jgi:hypothetical protein
MSGTICELLIIGKLNQLAHLLTYYDWALQGDCFPETLVLYHDKVGQ